MWYGQRRLDSIQDILGVLNSGYAYKTYGLMTDVMTVGLFELLKCSWLKV